jgi:hypothetical protein
MGARNRAGIGLSYRTARLHTTQPGGISSLESILGLLKVKKIPGSGAYLLGGGEAASCCRLCSPFQLTMRWGGKDKGLNTGLIVSQGGVGGRRKEEGRREGGDVG